ncbi:unnamed protein product, partial [Symbiodinium necroappetens]
DDDEMSEAEEGANRSQNKRRCSFGSDVEKPSNSTPNEKKPKKAWFDRDASITSALKQHQTWVKATRASITSTIQQLQDSLGKVTADVEDEVRNEAKLAKNRLHALKLILGKPEDGEQPGGQFSDVVVSADGDSKPDKESQKEAGTTDQASQKEAADQAQPNADQAKEAEKTSDAKEEATKETSEEAKPDPDVKAPSTVAKFVADNGGAQKALRKYIASFSTDGKKTLGGAPPCRSYQALIVISEFDDKATEIEEAETKEALVAIQNGMKIFKNAYADLLAMARAAKNRLESSITDVKRQQQRAKDIENGQKAAATRGRPRKSAQQQNAALFVDSPEVVGKDIPSVQADGYVPPAMDHAKPHIVRLSQEVMNKLAPLKHTLASLETKFKGDTNKLEAGRSQRLLPPDQRELVDEVLETLFPPNHILPKDKIVEKLKAEVLMPIGFVIATACVTASAESAHLPTCRLGISGNRQVVCIPTLHLLALLNKGCETKADLARAYHFLKTASLKTFQEGQQGDDSCVYHATVGPGDLLYLPAGWCFFERVAGKSNYLGVKIQHLSLQSLPVLRNINSYLLAISKPNSNLQSAVDCLTRAET